MPGAIYAPTASLALSGQLNSAIVVDTMTFTGSGVEDIRTLDVPSSAAQSTVMAQSLGNPGAPTATSRPSCSSTSLIALDLALADVGTIAEGTASGVTPMAVSRGNPQTAGKGSALKVVTTAPRQPAIDPGAVDALLLGDLSLRSRGFASRPGQPMKWSL